MRILLPYWQGVPDKCFYQEFHAGIAESLRELGHEHVEFSFADRGQLTPEGANRLYRQLEAAKPDVVLDLACWGFGLSRILIQSKNGVSEPIMDLFGIPYAGWLFDQPCNQDLGNIMAKVCVAVYPDRGFPAQARLIYPDLAPAREIFAPPAIRLENDHSAAIWSHNRTIDVLYIGNFVPEATERPWRRSGGQAPGVFDALFCDSIADAALARLDLPLHVSLQKAIAERGAMPAGFPYATHLSIVEIFLRHVLRREAVLSLARSGVRMHVVGNGWDKVGLPANVELGAHTDYDGIFDLAARARICLDASTYIQGANDRVFSYLLNRAVCFTNANGYLRDIFGENGGARFYSMRDLSGLAEQVATLLGRPEALRDAAESVAEVVRTSHCWRHRLSVMLDAMRPVIRDQAR